MDDVELSTFARAEPSATLHRSTSFLRLTLLVSWNSPFRGLPSIHSTEECPNTLIVYPALSTLISWSRNFFNFPEFHFTNCHAELSKYFFSSKHNARVHHYFQVFFFVVLDVFRSNYLFVRTKDSFIFAFNKHNIKRAKAKKS